MSVPSQPSNKPSLTVVLVVGALVLIGVAFIARDLINLQASLTPLPTATPTPAQAAQAAAAATETPVPVAPTATPTLTPFVVTPPPPATDVFAAATLSAQATASAETEGTATPPPSNMITATFTPKPVVVTNTPTPVNTATAEYRNLLATAVAFTTGTATPPPGGLNTATSTPTATATEVFLALEDLPPTATPPAFPRNLKGLILFTGNMNGPARTYALDPESGDITLLTADWPLARAAQRDTWSAEKGNRVYVGLNLETGQAQLFYNDVPTDTSRPISVTLGGSPVWSPVEDRIAYVSREGGNEDIWVTDLDGADRQQLTSNRWAADTRPSWSPNGEQIIFTSNRSGKRQLWIMDADGGNQRALTSHVYEAWDAVWVKYAD